MAALTPGVALWVVGDEPGAELFAGLRARAGVSVAVSSDPGLLYQADIALPLPPGLPSWALPIVAIAPAQAAALRLAELRGVAVDSPHGLAKVTLTR